MKTVSLELAKQLKEAGYPQEGDFYWQRSHHDKPYRFNPGGSWETVDEDGIITAPTADEILDLLPVTTLSMKLSQDGYVVAYRRYGGGMTADILADAAAKMWLYLKKEGLLNNI